MTHKAIMTFVIAFSVSCMAYAQIPSASSTDNEYFESQQLKKSQLLLQLSKAKDDTNKVNILNALSIGASNSDTTLFYAQKAKQLSEKINFKRGTVEAYTNMVIYQIDNGYYAEALKYSFNALEISREINYKKGMVESYTCISRVYQNQGKYQEALENCMEALKISKEANYKWHSANIHSLIASIYKQMGNYTGALENDLTALKLNEELGDKKAVAGSLHNIGNFFYENSNYPKALEYYIEALAINKEISFKPWEAINYTNIGSVQEALGNYSKALENYLAALKINELLKRRMDMAQCYMKIGVVYLAQKQFEQAAEYFSMGLNEFEKTGNKAYLAHYYNYTGISYYEQGDYNNAMKNFLKCLEIHKEETGSKVGTATAYGNIGMAYYGLGNSDKALEYHFTSLKLLEELADNTSIANAYNNIGNAYILQNNISEGKKWLQKGLALAKTTGAKDWIKENYEGLIKADSISGNYKDAFENYKMFIWYRDSLYNEENTIKITQAALQYDFDKKEAGYQYQKQLADEQLRQQKQELQINKQALTLAHNEKEIEHLAYLNTQVQLDAEFNKRKINEKELELLAQKQNYQDTELKLKKTELALKEKELQAKKTERNLYLLSGMLLAGAGAYAFYRFRQRKQQENRQALLAERLRLSRDLHDDIGSTLSSLNFYSEIATGKLKKQRQDEAMDILNKMGNASRVMTERISDLVWSINPENDSVQHTTDRLKSIAAGLFQHTDIRYLFDSKGIDEAIPLTIEQRKNLLLIYKEALNNIVKYAACNTVAIGLYLDKGRLTLSIKDDGAGFDRQQQNPANKTGGNGLKNMEARARQIGGELAVNSEKGKGTEIVLSFALI